MNKKDKGSDIVNELHKSLKGDKFIQAIGLASDWVKFSSFVPFGVLTGIPQLDLAIGRPGMPAGRIVETYGFERSGKSALSMAAAYATQMMGGVVLWCEAEHTFDFERAQRAGIDVSKLVLVEVESIESIFRVIEKSLDALPKATIDTPILFVIDSITATTDEWSLSQKTDDGLPNRPGVEAKVIRTGLKRLNSKLAEKNAVALFVNHAIANFSAFGSGKQSAGGHALKFYASLRIGLTHKGNIQDSDKNTIGQKIGLHIEKIKGTAEQTTKSDLEMSLGNFDVVDSLRLALMDSGYIKGDKQQTLDWEGREISFHKEDWASVVEKELGGFNKAYKDTVARWLKDGKLEHWGANAGIETKDEE